MAMQNINLTQHRYDFSWLVTLTLETNKKHYCETNISADF